MFDLFTTTTMKCSRLITRHYSTSFSLGISTMDKRFHYPIYAIYGFVRFADEIVDTFHAHNKEELLHWFKLDTHRAIREQVSLNPVLHSFQYVVHRYGIDLSLIDAFLKSMEMDLSKERYSRQGYEEYIYGSAEVVGLMCLRVFCEGDDQLYSRLSTYARRLGAAFQKVNFLRDIKSDYQDLGRMYFPGIDFSTFSDHTKKEIEKDIEGDFVQALIGIKNLPKGARGGVYLAYIYYYQLFKKIRSLSPAHMLTRRIRIPDLNKMLLLSKSLVLNRFNSIL